MAQITLILGESGTGKTASLRNFKPGEIALVNVAGKALPFKAKFESLNDTTDYQKIIRFMQNTTAKTIIIDDCQYIMSFAYMRRLKESGWEKFNDIQGDFFNIIEAAKALPEDVTVYFLSHLETKDDGRQRIKTIGKMLDEKITIEGMFTTVLKTYVADGKYSFLTQNSGMDTVKSPIGMFPSFAIDNDLKYVDEKIRNYYELTGAKTDEEMNVADKNVQRSEIEQAPNGRIKRTARPTRTSAENQAQTDNSTATEQVVEEAKNEQPRERRQRRTRNTPTVNEIDEDDLPF